MALENLTGPEKQVALRAVRLLATTNVIEDDELFTVTGFERHELLDIHRLLENGRGEHDEKTTRAVGQSLNSLAGYPHQQDATVEKELGCSMDDLARLADKWFGRASHPEPLQ